jgi:hypothetical protein
MCGRGGDGGAADARAAEEERQANVRAATDRINTTFTQFDDPFDQGRERAFLDYANPQLDDQYGKARRDLIFALANAGTTRSSVAGQQLADLERDYGLRKVEVADQARGYAQQARGDVEAARGGLIQQAVATGDAALAGTGAVNEANRLVSAQSFSPLGQVFQNVGAGVGAVRRAQDAEAVRGQITGAKLFQPASASTSMRVVN